MVAKRNKFRCSMLILLLLFTSLLSFSQNSLSDFFTVKYVDRSISLNKVAKDTLTKIADVIKENPEWRLVVRGYCSNSKLTQQNSWDRVNSVISYLVDKEGISQDRFIFEYGVENGNCNNVDIIKAKPGVEGPTTQPAPHPNLRRRS